MVFCALACRTCVLHCRTTPNRNRVVPSTQCCRRFREHLGCDTIDQNSNSKSSATRSRPITAARCDVRPFSSTKHRRSRAILMISTVLLAHCGIQQGRNARDAGGVCGRRWGSESSLFVTGSMCKQKHCVYHKEGSRPTAFPKRKGSKSHRAAVIGLERFTREDVLRLNGAVSVLCYALLTVARRRTK